MIKENGGPIVKKAKTLANEDSAVLLKQASKKDKKIEESIEDEDGRKVSVLP